MMTIVDVDFRSAADPSLARVPHRIPQFFDEDANPLPLPNRYLRELARRLMLKSLRTTMEHLKEFFDWVFVSGLEVEDITDSSFDNYIDALCIYKKTNGKPLSWNTVNSRVSGAYSFLIWAVELGKCPNLELADAINSYRSMRKKYKTRGHPSKKITEPTKFLLLHDAVRFVDMLAEISGTANKEVKKRNKLIGALMLQSGLRISEVTSFPLRDLPEVNHRGHSTPARLIGKAAKARVILIPNSLLIKIWEYVDFDRERICDLAREQDRNSEISENLFISEKGSSISSNWIEKLFSRASCKLGLKTTPHSLRHTYATYHYLLNKDLSGLATLLGHAQESTTRKYYVHTAILVSYIGTYSALQDEIDKLIEV